MGRFGTCTIYSYDSYTHLIIIINIVIFFLVFEEEEETFHYLETGQETHPAQPQQQQQQQQHHQKEPQHQQHKRLSVEDSNGGAGFKTVEAPRSIILFIMESADRFIIPHCFQ